MIRRARESDLYEIVRIGRRHHEAAQMPGRFDGEAFRRFAEQLVTGRGVVFLTDEGMIGGTLAPSYASPGYWMAVELFWWSEDRQGRALLRAFEAWAEENGADEVRLSAVTRHRGAAVGRLLERAGYEPCEVSYSKGLN